jgi:ubiquinone/menaquinone biosynthesis C-methylase UbiE
MASLYEGKMAAIYDAMYQPLLITTKKYDFLCLYPRKQLQNNTGIGSGTGNLAKRFKKNQQDYTGLEYSQSMIASPKKEMNALSSWGYAGFQS